MGRQVLMDCHRSVLVFLSLCVSLIMVISCWYQSGRDTTLQRQTAVTAYLKSKQLQLCAFAYVNHGYKVPKGKQQ